MVNKKVKFSFAHKSLIESGRYRLETAGGLPVRVLCWDANNDFPIVALVNYNPDYAPNGDSPTDHNPGEVAYHYSKTGCTDSEKPELDLVTVTDEPKYNEFEEAISELIGRIDGDYYVVIHDYDDYINEFGPKILEAARKVMKVPEWHDTPFTFDKWQVVNENDESILCDGEGHHLYLQELVDNLPTAKRDTPK